MINLKNVSFKTKIQTSFFVVAAISTLLVVNDLYHFFQFSRINETLNNKIILSREHLTDVQAEFQSLQFYLLKFSIPGFENQFDKNFEAVDKHKKKIIETMALIKDSSLADIFEEHSQNFDKIFNEFFESVVDGTLSAAAMKDFEMASYIATTSGEELRKKFESEMADIMSDINNQKAGLESEVSSIMSKTIILILAGMLIGTLAFLFTFFKLIPTLTKPIEIIKELLKQFSLGNFEQKMESKNNDEFGQMAVMLNKLRDSQLEKIDAAEKIASGDLELKINALSDHDVLSKSFEKMIDNLNKLVLEIKFLTTASIKGNSGARGNTKVFSGGYKKIIEGMKKNPDALY
ncbi:MAG TPA: MCP four helix bundle domain-containing protein [Ignavibacteriaceae bacterium]|nr:MCP four helix bundle domain-containing protein [Ignavibacteriaceae bacterium]